jgi:hypothetical protein
LKTATVALFESAKAGFLTRPFAYLNRASKFSERSPEAGSLAGLKTAATLLLTFGRCVTTFYWRSMLRHYRLGLPAGMRLSDKLKRTPATSDQVRWLGGRFVQVGWCQVVREDGLEATGFVLIVQHNYRHYAQGLIATAAVSHFALQVLQKAIGKMILGALATGILLSPFAAVGTDIFDPVLLRIAVQSRPAGAAHADNFRVSPFHGFCLLKIHVHTECDAEGRVRDTEVGNILLFHSLRNF